MADRQLGGLRVSALGLGCMGLGFGYGRVDLAEAERAIRTAVDAGVTLFDTADIYGRGRSEEMLGRVLGPIRDQVTLASKVGLKAWSGVPTGRDGTPRHIRRNVDRSLARLRTDHLDLYYLHRVDPRVPVEESVGALAELVQAGKVRHIGISQCTPDELRRAHATHPLAALQVEWSLFARDSEAVLVPQARELGVGLVAYAPIGRGLLSGRPEAVSGLSLVDFRRYLPWWRRANLAHNVTLAQRVRELAAPLGLTAAQLALAWLLARGPDVVPIPGSKTRAHVLENVAATGRDLPPATLAALDDIRPAGSRTTPTAAS